MSDFKFKEGDLVEIINNCSHKGHRFTVGNFKVTTLETEDGLKFTKRCKAYESDVKTTHTNKLKWTPESWIKRVNPDIDKITDSTFSEIMDEITEAITVEQ